MNNQVLTIEQMQELKKLGIDISNASMYWVENDFDASVDLCINFYPEETNKNVRCTPTFILQDILEMLPKELAHWKEGVKYRLYMSFYSSSCTLAYEAIEETCEYTYENISTLHRCYGSHLEAAFNMLKWCKQNNYI